MNEEQYDRPIDPELEARIVALVMGEASDFERDELDRITSERPEVASFKAEMQRVDALMRDVGAGDAIAENDDWKLSSQRRSALLAVLSGEATEPSIQVAKTPVEPRGKKQRYSLMSFAKIAAMIAVAGFFGRLLLPTQNAARRVSSRNEPTDATPLLSTGSAWSYSGAAGEDEAELDMVMDGSMAMGAPENFSRGLGAATADTKSDYIKSAESLSEIRDALGAETKPPSPHYLQDDVRFFGVQPEFELPADAISHELDVADLAMPAPASGENMPGLGTPSLSVRGAIADSKRQVKSPDVTNESVWQDLSVASVPQPAMPLFENQEWGQGQAMFSGAAGASTPDVDKDIEFNDRFGADGGSLYGAGGYLGGGGQASGSKAGGEPLAQNGQRSGEPSGQPKNWFGKESGSTRSDNSQQSARFDGLETNLGQQSEAFQFEQSSPEMSAEAIVQEGKADADKPADQDLYFKGRLAEPNRDATASHDTRAKEDFGTSDRQTAKPMNRAVIAQPRGERAAGQGIPAKEPLLMVQPRIVMGDEEASVARFDGEDSNQRDFFERADVSGESTEAKKGQLQIDSLGKERDGLAGIELQRRYGLVPERIVSGFESSTRASVSKSVAPAGLNETSAAKEAFSTFSLHVSDVSFKLARAALAGGEWPEAANIRIEEFVNAFDYGDPMPSRSEKVACQIEQAAHPFLQQRNLMRVSMRTAAAGRASNTPLRLTFLLDNSGSMERIDRAQTVRRAFSLLTQQLQPTDQVTLISFARQPRLLADKVSGAESQQLVGLVENLPSEGGTNIEAALNLAFEKARSNNSMVPRTASFCLPTVRSISATPTRKACPK